MRAAGVIATPWVDFQRTITEAVVPAGAVVVKNEVGNLSILSAEGAYIGFIDPLRPEVVINAGQ